MVKDKVDYSKFEEIEKSKGNIIKLPFYKDLERSIILLSNIAERTSNTPDEIKILKSGLSNCITLNHYFVEGFRQNNEMVMLIYNNFVMSLIKGTSFLISNCIEYVKNSYDTYSVVFKYNLGKNQDFKIYYDNLDKINKATIGGKMDDLLSKLLEVKNLAEIPAIIIAVPGVMLMFGSLIFIIRELIYIYYYVRSNISYDIKQLALFIELNASTLDSDLKSVKQKQDNIVKNLLKISDILAVDNKNSIKTGKESLIKDINNETLPTTIKTSTNLVF
jgi:hypothetical protein